MKECDAKKWARTDFEKNVSKLYFDDWSTYSMCIDDPNEEVFLQGNWNSQYM